MRKLNGVNSAFVNWLIHITVPVLMFFALVMILPDLSGYWLLTVGAFLWLFFLFRVWLFIAERYIGFQDDA
jgi:hypothetical protein